MPENKDLSVYQALRREVNCTIAELSAGWSGRALVLCGGSGADALVLSHVGRCGLVTSVDIDPLANLRARIKTKSALVSPSTTIRFLQMDAHAAIKIEQQWDLITCIFGLHLLTEKDQIVQKCINTISPDGIFFHIDWARAVWPNADSYSIGSEKAKAWVTVHRGSNVI